MRRRTIAIIAAVVLALVAAGLVVWYVSSVRNKEVVAEPTQTVLIAASDITEGTTGEAIVSNKLVQHQEVVVSSVTPGALTSETQLQGKVLMVPVAKGQQILQSQLGTPEQQNLSYRIKTGMRAISIAIDRRNAVGGFIKEGDRVDVIATFDADQFDQVRFTPTTVPAATPAAPGAAPTTSTTAGQPTGMGLGMVLAPAEIARIKQLTGIDLTQTVASVSITLLQQVDVLAIDDLLPSTGETTSGGGVFSSGSRSTTQEVPESPVITLMLSPSDAEKIVYAETYGKITFTLIPANDTAKVDTTGHALPNLFR